MAEVSPSAFQIRIKSGNLPFSGDYMIFKAKSAAPLFANHQGFNWHLRLETHANERETSQGSGSTDTLRNSIRNSPETSDIAGILIVNGVKVIHLNSTAYAYVKNFIQTDQNHRRTVWRMALGQGIGLKRAHADWEKLYADLLQASAGCCEGSGIQIRGDITHFTAPLRVDLALTYRCNNDCTHCYAGGHHETAELSAREWCSILDKLHAAGVPQVVFTGGESLLRPELEELVYHAKSLQMITGLITNGRLLTPARIASLSHAGLDFVQITVESVDPVIHNAMIGLPMNPDTSNRYDNLHNPHSLECLQDIQENFNNPLSNAFAETMAGVQNALGSSLQVTTNTTITNKNAATIIATIQYLTDLGVKRIGINGLIRAERGKSTDGVAPDEMQAILTQVRDLCGERGVQMIWFTPGCYKLLNPISLQLDAKSCSAASIVLAIEPTGRVIPCQSYFEGLGDARTDSFAQIWNHPLALCIREKQWVKSGCRECRNFQACGGGCPLESASTPG